jgi:hypothetical protein
MTMSNGKLVVVNNLVGNGNMILTGTTTELRGNSVQTLFGAPAFGNLTINKSGGSLTLPSTLSTTGTFFLGSGSIALPSAANYTLNGLAIGSGANLDINGGTVNVTGTLNNSLGGNLNHTGGVINFSGTTKGSILGNLTLTSLTLNKTGTSGNDSLLVPGTISLNGPLTLTKGYLNTGLTGRLQLGSTATMTSETNTARVVGTLSQSIAINATPGTFAGSIASISPGTEQLGLVSVERISGLSKPGSSYATTPLFPVSKSIDAIWRIEPAQQPSNPVQLTLRWTSALDNGNSRSVNMFAYRRPAPYTGLWLRNSNVPVTFSNNVATLTTSEFSEWTVSDLNNPLPVELVSFNGTWNRAEEKVDLTWLTASEKDNSHFIVERSADQQDWLPIGTVQGRGTTYDRTRYNLADPSAPSGLNYYRLTQVDFNGTENKSFTIAVMVGQGKVSNWRVYPNPTYNNITIEAFGLEGSETDVVLTDVLGKIVLSKQFKVSLGGLLQQRLSLVNLPAGVYNLKITDQEGRSKNAMIEKK